MCFQQSDTFKLFLFTLQKITSKDTFICFVQYKRLQNATDLPVIYFANDLEQNLEEVVVVVTFASGIKHRLTHTFVVVGSSTYNSLSLKTRLSLSNLAHSSLHPGLLLHAYPSFAFSLSQMFTQK